MRLWRRTPPMQMHVEYNRPERCTPYDLLYDRGHSPPRDVPLRGICRRVLTPGMGPRRLPAFAPTARAPNSPERESPACAIMAPSRPLERPDDLNSRRKTPVLLSELPLRLQLLNYTIPHIFAVPTCTLLLIYDYCAA